MPVVNVLTDGIGEVNLRDIDVYRNRGGYAQWQRALTELQPENIAQMTSDSGLRGRGGAGFPTGRKWSFLPKNGRPRYLVCNCDEAEPGTFKDHMLLLETPHQVLEGILLGAYAIGSHHAFMYIRGEFEQGYRVFMEALAQARAAGFVGQNVFGTDYGIEVTVHRGAGAYICGEETALLNSLEGKRGEPRLKPPFPAVKGLYGEPTVVNNVETLATLPHILKNGPQWFASVGPPRSPGFKIVSVSGHVRRPGNYEVPLGTPLRELLEIAGGPREGRTIVAVQPGGGSSACLFAEDLDLPYDFDTMAQHGTMLGSGAIVFFDETTNFVEAALALVRFFAHESCGQCTPCREGGHWLEVTLNRILSGGGLDSDIDLLLSVSHQLTGINLCPLGDSIEPFLASVVRRFEPQFRGYVRRPESILVSA
ncbi:MAG: NADH-quinone oxidoreductase subunit NuoF [Candidatus Eremiobacteraeota bacterium]|nr:NADH-quinone oxidoreductase subunit NuoF [Candidatus Eremiobacteraeota bacterium]MBC5803543.1 NADH-quinone oxidoreductase subunit NuoF [Candidatus Eremiobacteraeota bacterium]MBC5822874.1 NADH-quinone oxidoreductase subunit NuoF [Candidatus Eremiobacteraeota bacterium]